MTPDFDPQPDMKKKETSANKSAVNIDGKTVPVFDKESSIQPQTNRCLPGVCEQLPHHCLQLYCLS